MIERHDLVARSQVLNGDAAARGSNFGPPHETDDRGVINRRVGDEIRVARVVESGDLEALNIQIVERTTVPGIGQKDVAVLRLDGRCEDIRC